MSYPLFNGKIYDFWFVKMRIILLSNNPRKYVEDRFEELVDPTTLTDAQKHQLKELRKKDAKALTLIQQGVAHTIFPRIINKIKVNEACEIL